MNKSSKRLLTEKHKNRIHQEYAELIDMIESNMEDYEIADEIGITQNHVSEIKKQIINDMV